VGLELADIFRQYGPAYLQKYADQLLPSHRQAMRSIEQCRTQALGGQVYACPTCSEVQHSYHSCRNRHCPKCQNDKAQEWLEAQQDLLLPVPYFMLTFTLPAALNEIVRSNQNLLYNLLFRVSAAAAQHLAPYVFRLAISNRRLVKLENDKVTFRYRATDTGEPKLCTLSAEAFIHRFLQHVLPKAFVKVRYYGFFAPGCRKHLMVLRQQLEQACPDSMGEPESLSEPADATPETKLCCPSGGQPMLLQRTIQPTGRCPP